MSQIHHFSLWGYRLYDSHSSQNLKHKIKMAQAIFYKLIELPHQKSVLIHGTKKTLKTHKQESSITEAASEQLWHQKLWFRPPQKPGSQTEQNCEVKGLDLGQNPNSFCLFSPCQSSARQHMPVEHNLPLWSRGRSGRHGHVCLIRHLWFIRRLPRGISVVELERERGEGKNLNLNHYLWIFRHKGDRNMGSSLALWLLDAKSQLIGKNPDASQVKWSEVAQSCLTLCDPVDCSPPGFFIHGIFQARILEWGAISHFTLWATREGPPLNVLDAHN